MKPGETAAPVAESGELTVTDLYVYPVKSCAGIRVERARVQRGGFEDDRRWMIVDPSGKFVSQRELPALSGIRLEFGRAGSEPTYRMSTAGQASIEFPRRLRGEALLREAAEVRARVWRDEVRALEWRELSLWLSLSLRRPLRAVFLSESELRQVDLARALPGDRVGLADGYPFLLVSRESLAELNRRAALEGRGPFEMRRFRPNIVVEGCASPHEEDDWEGLQIGEVGMRVVKPCDRCSVVSVDPDSGQRGKEPLRTLASYRRRDGKVWFAVNLVHEAVHVGRFLLRGDVVQVTSRIAEQSKGL